MLKELIAADINNVFLNADEFAELVDIKYDGSVYRDVPAVFELTKRNESEQLVMESQRMERDTMHGIHVASTVVHFSEQALGVVPEQGQWIWFRDGTALGTPYWNRYRILISDVEMGMVELGLEKFDE